MPRDESDDDHDYENPPGTRPRRRAARRDSGRPGDRKRTVLVVGCVLGVLLLGCCGGVGGLLWYHLAPTTFPEQTQDYADARKGFKTTLTATGPAPQTFDPLDAPPGAKEVAYISGTLKLKAWVDKDERGPPRPAVLFLHGGFALAEEDWDQCEPFRAAGFVTMVPAWRGENGQPGSYTMFYDEVDDVLAALDALAAMPGVNPDRIFVAGHSAGGTLAMLAAMTSKRFKGCASFSGSPDQVAFVRTDPHLAPFDTNDRRELEMRSPLAFPKSFKCPARLYWGNEELAFKFSTQRLAEKAAANGQDVRAVEVPGEHTSAVAPAMQQAIAFFKQR